MLSGNRRAICCPSSRASRPNLCFALGALASKKFHLRNSAARVFQGNAHAGYQPFILRDTRLEDDVTTKAKEYETRARELESAARVIRNPQAQQDLLDLARQWRHMAEGWGQMLGWSEPAQRQSVRPATAYACPRW
jgi:hypothetical protein